MKKLLILLLLFPIALHGQGKYKTMVIHKRKTESAPTWTNLVRWWDMTETSGGVTYDLVGSDDGTITGATQAATGLVFDGSGDYVTLSSGFNYSAGTILVWIKPNGDGTVDVWGGASGAMKMTFYSEYRPRFMEVCGGGTSVVSFSLTNATWNLLGVVWDNSANTVRYSLNGGSFETETDWTYDPTVNMTRIGKNITCASYSDFIGEMKKFAVFSDKKSDAYITAFYNSGSGTEYTDGDPL